MFFFQNQPLFSKEVTNIIQQFFTNIFVNSFSDPLSVLFLNRISRKLLTTWRGSKRVKLRKFKLKRRKLRKIYVLRKLRKIIFFKKLKKKFFANTSSATIKTYSKIMEYNKTLVKRIPVSRRIIESTSVEFFYKLNKKDILILKRTLIFKEQTKLITHCIFVIIIKNHMQNWEKPVLHIGRCFFIKLYENKDIRALLTDLLKNQINVFILLTFYFRFLQN